MRKLAWFVIIVFGLVLALAIASAVSPPFKEAFSSMLNGVGGGILTNVGNGLQYLGDIASTNVTNIVISGGSLLIAGGILFGYVVRKLWAKRPQFLKKEKETQPPIMREPTSVIIREVPVGTSTQAPTAPQKPKEETQEVPA